MNTETQHTDRSKVVQLIPVQPGAYFALFSEVDSYNSSRKKVGNMPVVALALVEFDDGTTMIDAVMADRGDGLSLHGDLSNALGVCTADQLEEATENHAEGQITYKLGPDTDPPRTNEFEPPGSYEDRILEIGEEILKRRRRL